MNNRARSVLLAIATVTLLVAGGCQLRWLPYEHPGTPQPVQRVPGDRAQDQEEQEPFKVRERDEFLQQPTNPMRRVQ